MASLQLYGLEILLLFLLITSGQSYSSYDGNSWYGRRSPYRDYVYVTGTKYPSASGYGTLRRYYNNAGPYYYSDYQYGNGVSGSRRYGVGCTDGLNKYGGSDCSKYPERCWQRAWSSFMWRECCATCMEAVNNRYRYYG